MAACISLGSLLSLSITGGGASAQGTPTFSGVTASPVLTSLQIEPVSLPRDSQATHGADGHHGSPTPTQGRTPTVPLLVCQQGCTRTLRPLPQPNFVSGSQPTMRLLVCQQGCMHSLGPLPPHYRGFCPTLSLGRSPPLSRWSANRAAHTLGGCCPLITRAAAPSLPGPQPTMLSLVCQQGCTLSLGPLPHHYQGPSPTLSQGRSPPWARWFANRDARMGVCPRHC